MAETRRAALYVGPTAPAQALGTQVIDLVDHAHRAGWTRPEFYTDLKLSRSELLGETPGFERMLKDAGDDQFDVLMVWSIDQLGSSLQELAVILGRLEKAGVELYVKEPEIDTTRPSGRVLFEAIGLFAGFEPLLARKRMQLGVLRARKAGKRFGRPKLAPARVEAIRASLAGGLSIRKTARLHGVGISSVQRLKKSGGGEGG